MQLEWANLAMKWPSYGQLNIAVGFCLGDPLTDPTVPVYPYNFSTTDPLNLISSSL
jgi:hypothetical protein